MTKRMNSSITLLWSVATAVIFAACASAPAPKAETPEGAGAVPTSAETTDVAVPEGAFAKFGPLKVSGTKLTDKAGNPVQLRGVSTHGLQWFPWGEKLTAAAIDTAAYDWKADVFRTAMYVDEGGYNTDPVKFYAMVETVVKESMDRGMYAIIDWHILTPGDPMVNVKAAKDFFDRLSKRFGGTGQVMYEICNEPNGDAVTWAVIKKYAEEVIPVIRANDPDGIIIVGTPAWSSFDISGPTKGADIVADPLTGDMAHNAMYAFHFYAASHTDEHRTIVDQMAGKFPIFASEWGSQNYSGEGPNDIESSEAWLALFDKHQISWVNWNYSDDHRSGAVWKTGIFPAGPHTDQNLKESGILVKKWINQGR